MDQDETYLAERLAAAVDADETRAAIGRVRAQLRPLPLAKRRQVAVDTATRARWMRTSSEQLRLFLIAIDLAEPHRSDAYDAIIRGTAS